MKTTLRIALLLALAHAAFAQSDARKSFDKLKALAGTWEGKMTTTPKFDGVEGTATRVTFRVTSMGHALMHEMAGEGRPDDPITMLYLDDDALALTHYCDAGNRPRMAGKASPDGTSVSFELTDIAGSMEPGHMHGTAFTFVDADHHSEDWMFMMPGGKPVHAHVELHRVEGR